MNQFIVLFGIFFVSPSKTPESAALAGLRAGLWQGPG